MVFQSATQEAYKDTAGQWLCTDICHKLANVQVHLEH